MDIDPECIWANDLDLAGNYSHDVGPHVVLGVDGGATSTICVVVECEKAGSHRHTAAKHGRAKVLGRGASTCSNHNSVGAEAARRALETSMAAALRSASLPRASVGAVCLCLAGVDRPADKELVITWIREILPSSVRAVVHNDAVGALASGTGGVLQGCVLIAGTGTIALGFGAGGEAVRAAGGGPALGDRGSGFAIATEALGAVMRAADGRGPATALTEAVLGALGLDAPEDLIGWAYADPSWARVAALAPCVRACADKGDAVAGRLLAEAAEELAGSVEAVATRAGLKGTAFPLVLVGGVLSDAKFADSVTARVLERLPTADVIKPEMEPAVGAALLALSDLTALS